MADKGFDIKVLIPTEDGVTIAENKLDDVSYYLMYNISNRSYQLAGKLKVSDLLANEEFEQKLNEFIIEQKIDIILSYSAENTETHKNRIPVYEEINEELNLIIDLIDQKKEL